MRDDNCDESEYHFLTSGARASAVNRHTLLVALASLLAFRVANAATTEVGPTDDVEAAINALNPGDELLLQGGTYTLTDRFGISVSGTAQAPIVVRAKDGEKPHLTRASANQNVVDSMTSNYLTLRGIEFSGGSHGIRIDPSDVSHDRGLRHPRHAVTWR